MIEKYELLNQERKMQSTKRKVAAYCRVSTDSEDQANSFESQQRYFRQYIEHHPDWELYEVFADEGISGTNTKKRKEFNRMIACAKEGKFDLIITKEISRFARNTLDSIFYTRELKKHGVAVIFMNDGINTMDGDAELRLAIMSSIAQEESRKTSERVKWGQKRQMEQGVVFGRDMLGYDVKDGKMTINEEDAEIVKLIFHKFANEGKGTHVIARELHEAGISPMRIKRWSNTAILRVIKNEKYCGDLVQKKTITPDFLSHEKKYNHGEEEFVIIKDHHEPIISRELFEKANRLLESRALSQEGKAKHSNRYPFSGKIKCGKCGSSFVARYKTRKDGSQYKAWRCYEAANHGRPHVDKAGNNVGCCGESIRNEDTIYLMYLVCKQLNINREKVAKNLVRTIESVISSDSGNADTDTLYEKIEEIKKKRTGLIELYTGGDIDKEEFTMLRDKYDEEIYKMKAMAEGVEKQQELIRKQQELLLDIKNAVNELANGVLYEDEFYSNLLDKMVVQDKEHIDIYLNMLPYKWSYTVAQRIYGVYQSIGTDFEKRSITDTYVGTEELAHVEMISAILYQLTKDLTIDEIQKSGFDKYFVDHTLGIYPTSASGAPFTAAYFQSKGDPITDMTEDMAAEQKARSTYDNILRLADDPDVKDAIRFLRQREVVHFQRFGEGLRIIQDHLNSKNFYACNPAFNKNCGNRNHRG